MTSVFKVTRINRRVKRSYSREVDQSIITKVHAVVASGEVRVYVGIQTATSVYEKRDSRKEREKCLTLAKPEVNNFELKCQSFSGL